MFPHIQALRHPQQSLCQMRCVAEKQANQTTQKDFPHSAVAVESGIMLDCVVLS